MLLADGRTYQMHLSCRLCSDVW